MRLKIILIIGGILAILSLALFGSVVKEKAIRGMIDDVPEYNCRKDDICTSCIIKGHPCSCGADICSCGNETVDKAQCELYS